MASIMDFDKASQGVVLFKSLRSQYNWLTAFNALDSINLGQLQTLIRKVNGAIASITRYTDGNGVWFAANYEAESGALVTALAALEVLRDGLQPINATAQSDMNDAFALFRAARSAAYGGDIGAYLADSEREFFVEPEDLIDVEAVQALVATALEGDPLVV